MDNLYPYCMGPCLLTLQMGDFNILYGFMLFGWITLLFFMEFLLGIGIGTSPPISQGCLLISKGVFDKESNYVNAVCTVI